VGFTGLTIAAAGAIISNHEALTEVALERVTQNSSIVVPEFDPATDLIMPLRFINQMIDSGFSVLAMLNYPVIFAKIQKYLDEE